MSNGNNSNFTPEGMIVSLESVDRAGGCEKRVMIRNPKDNRILYAYQPRHDETGNEAVANFVNGKYKYHLTK